MATLLRGKFVGGNMTGPLEVFCPQTCEVRVDEVADFRAKKLCFQGNVHVTSVCYIDKYVGINFLFPSEMPSHKPMILSKIVLFIKAYFTWKDWTLKICFN